MEMAFGGKELVLTDYPDFNLRRIHYRLIRDKGLTVVRLMGAASADRRALPCAACRRWLLLQLNGLTRGALQHAREHLRNRCLAQHLTELAVSAASSSRSTGRCSSTTSSRR